MTTTHNTPVRYAVHRTTTDTFLDADGHFGPLETAYFWTEATWAADDMDHNLNEDELRVRVAVTIIPD